MKLPIVLALIMTTPFISRAGLKTETVDYKQGDTTLEGYLAYNEKADKRSWEAMKTFLTEIFSQSR